MLPRYAIDVHPPFGGLLSVILFGEDDVETFVRKARRMNLSPTDPILISSEDSIRLRLHRTAQQEAWVQDIIEMIFPAPAAPF
jgi:hypothetical protein